MNDDPRLHNEDGEDHGDSPMVVNSHSEESSENDFEASMSPLKLKELLSSPLLDYAIRAMNIQELAVLYAKVSRNLTDREQTAHPSKKILEEDDFESLIMEEVSIEEFASILPPWIYTYVPNHLYFPLRVPGCKFSRIEFGTDREIQTLTEIPPVVTLREMTQAYLVCKGKQVSLEYGFHDGLGWTLEQRSLKWKVSEIIVRLRIEESAYQSHLLPANQEPGMFHFTMILGMDEEERNRFILTRAARSQ